MKETEKREKCLRGFREKIKFDREVRKSKRYSCKVCLLFALLSLNSHGTYRKVASSRLSQLVAHPRIFRLFMKGNFDAYVL